MHDRMVLADIAVESPPSSSSSSSSSSTADRLLGTFSGRWSHPQSRDRSFVPPASAAAGQVAMGRSRQASRTRRRVRAAASPPFTAPLTPGARRIAEYLAGSYEMRAAVVRRVVEAAEAKGTEAREAEARQSDASESVRSDSSASDDEDGDEDEDRR